MTPQEKHQIALALNAGTRTNLALLKALLALAKNLTPEQYAKIGPILDEAFERIEAEGEAVDKLTNG